MITLRDYQQDAYTAVQQSFLQGHKRPLVCLPCGAGKSYIFASMVENCRGDVLVLTHRRELKQQHEELLASFKLTNARVAMVLTEANRLGQYQTPALIVADEAHLTRTKSWEDVLNYYNTFTVGFTATPIRLDGKPLGDIYDDLFVGVGAQYLIDNKKLSPYEYYAPLIADAEGLPSRYGDFETVALETLMCNRAIYGDALRQWQRLANGKKTIAYCVSVKHAQETADTFNAAGIAAVAISAKTPAKEREKIMQDFRHGIVTVLCNVGIISEGVSINDVVCCLLLRPTESLALYWQQAMRCMRYQEGKTAIIIDCVGNYTRNPLPGADYEWSLSQSAKKPKRYDDEGNFLVRVCPECFKTFKTAPVCPYCGYAYPLHQREIKAKQEIELARITAEQAAVAEERKKAMRREVQAARTYPELAKIAKERGYSQGWVYMMLKARNKR